MAMVPKMTGTQFNKQCHESIVIFLVHGTIIIPDQLLCLYVHSLKVTMGNKLSQFNSFALNLLNNLALCCTRNSLL
jgi:hypothetical protein